MSHSESVRLIVTSTLLPETAGSSVFLVVVDCVRKTRTTTSASLSTDVRDIVERILKG